MEKMLRELANRSRLGALRTSRFRSRRATNDEAGNEQSLVAATCAKFSGYLGTGNRELCLSAAEVFEPLSRQGSQVAAPWGVTRLLTRFSSKPHRTWLKLSVQGMRCGQQEVLDFWIQVRSILGLLGAEKIQRLKSRII